MTSDSYGRPWLSLTEVDNLRLFIYSINILVQSRRFPSYDPGPAQGFILLKGIFFCHCCLSRVEEKVPPKGLYLSPSGYYEIILYFSGIRYASWRWNVLTSSDTRGLGAAGGEQPSVPSVKHGKAWERVSRHYQTWTWRWGHLGGALSGSGGVAAPSSKYKELNMMKIWWNLLCRFHSHNYKMWKLL